LTGKKKWILCFLISWGLLAALTWKYIPYHTAVEAEAHPGGYAAKVLFLGASAAGVGVCALFFVLNPNRVTPYVDTFSRFRFLLWQLIQRDFKSRYKRSVLGILWTLLNPLLTMMVLTMVFSHLFRFDIPNFPVYLLSGQIVFGFFSEATNTSMLSIVGGSSMLKKIYIPKYIFPLSRTLSGLVNLLLSLAAFLLVMVLTRAPFHWTLLLIPIPLFYTFLFSLGVSLFLASMTVFFRDLVYLYGILLTALTYFTPIFYPASIIPDSFKFILALNPMAHFILYFRSLALYGILPDVWHNLVCLSFGGAALLAGTFVFLSRQDRFILHM
jgi:ABC-type polysaccharide/polyol phosphate export permease